MARPRSYERHEFYPKIRELRTTIFSAGPLVGVRSMRPGTPSPSSDKVAPSHSVGSLIHDDVTPNVTGSSVGSSASRARSTIKNAAAKPTAAPNMR